MSDKMLWNKDKTASVSASFVRNFSIKCTREPDCYLVYGWFVPSAWYGTGSFLFGAFDSVETAREFLQGLHDYIES